MCQSLIVCHTILSFPLLMTQMHNSRGKVYRVPIQPPLVPIGAVPPAKSYDRTRKVYREQGIGVQCR